MGDAAGSENPSPFHPSPASLEFNGFVVIRGALSCALADECRDFVNDTLIDSLLQQKEEENCKELFGAIAPPRVDDGNSTSNASSSLFGYGAPVLHRWNVLLNGIDGASPTPDKTSNVVGRVLGEVLSASCGHAGGIGRSVGGFLEFVCGQDAELCDLSGLVSDPGSEEQVLHYDTRYSSAESSQGRATPVHESSREGAQNKDEEVVTQEDEGRNSTQSLVPLNPSAVSDGSTPAGAQQQHMKRLVTAFVALQDVTEAMGPTLIVPRTANKATHSEIYDAINPADLTAALEKYQSRGVECVLTRGDVVLMDSRALHLGGANTSDTRRILLDFAFVDPAVVPGTYCGCISPEVGDRRLKLSDYKDWTN